MEDNRPGYYAVIPADVRYDDRIPANAKLLYGEISALISADGYCFASNQYFSELYKMNSDSITRLISKLEKHGYIKRVLEKDKSGQVIGRKIYLNVSMPEIHPPDNFAGTSLQNNREGTDKKVGYTNLSNTVYIKENKKEKSGHGKRTPLTDAQLREIFVQWISDVAQETWTKNDKNFLYLALDGFYEPRANKKQEPARTKAAFKALSNRLLRYSDGSPAVMIDILERATTAGWKSVFPLNGSQAQVVDPAESREEEIWLN